MIVWLLDLNLSGTVFRFATKAASVVEGSTTYVYRDGLSPVSVDIGADGPSGRSVALTIAALPDGYASWVDVPGIRAMLESGSATLYRWREGDDRRKARTLAQGSISSPSLLRGNNPLTLSIDSPPWQDGTRVIAPTNMISTDTYPSPSAKTGTSAEPDPQAYGSYPPVVVGYPGDVVEVGSSSGAPSEIAVEGPPSGILFTRTSSWLELGEGTPALAVELNPGVWQWWDRIAIASHAVVATQVIIWDQSDKRWDLLPVYQQVNGQGQTFSYASYESSSKAWLRTWQTAGHERWAVWISEYGGGLPSDKGGTMEGLGEFLKWLLGKMSAPVALASQQGERAHLDAYKIAAYINTDITVWEWVSQEVLGLFPVRWVEADNGGYLRYWNLTPGAPPVARLNTATMPIEVVGDLLCDTGAVANFLTLRYAFGPDGVHKTLTLAAEADGDTQRRNQACATSEGRYGRIARTWTSKIIKDEATATRLLYGLARDLALGVWTCIIRDPDSRTLDHLTPGDRVVLTAAEYALTAQECVVGAIVFEGQETRVMLRLIEED